ncbi:hypothetical protein NTGBS_40081 [Candidatus Nitrotoga sp. BS]|nr:hypothetical protein NTGBS_40081 [Candidatus Nitrotoga sp. BS]
MRDPFLYVVIKRLNPLFSMAKSCFDHMGVYQDEEELETYQQGIQTVMKVP